MDLCDLCLLSPVDSVDQLTIIYNPFGHPVPRGRRSNIDTTGMYQNRSSYQYERENMKFWPPERKSAVLDTTYKIGDRPLQVFGTREYDPETKRYTYLLKADTYVRFTDIRFECKLITDKQDSISTHYIDDAAEALRSIRFSTPLFR